MITYTYPPNEQVIIEVIAFKPELFLSIPSEHKTLVAVKEDKS